MTNFSNDEGRIGLRFDFAQQPYAAALRCVEVTDGDEPKEMGRMALRVTGVTGKGGKC